MTFAELIEEIRQSGFKHDWWKNRTLAEALCLVHSEISEALEEDRNYHQPTDTYYSGTMIIDLVEWKHVSSIPTSICMKPEGIPSELADAIIRILDICEHYNINIEAAIREKMDYNETRPLKHGKKL